MTKQIKSNGRKGFSLVELIVVIAIMAVLVAVLAPSLLSYVERSRAQKDESAMGEVTNAVLLALADADVYDELLEHNEMTNVSCYIDKTTEGELTADPTITKEGAGDKADQYIYGDEARLADETEYYAAGNMRGVTITFKPSVGTKSTTYTLASGSINKYYNNKGAVMEDCPALYNTVRATVGDTIEQTSQTYRNSEYTIFIKMGSMGGAQSSAQDAVQVYGQYSGTNLPAKASEDVNVAQDRATTVGTPSAPSNPSTPSTPTINPALNHKGTIPEGATYKQYNLYYDEEAGCETYDEVVEYVAGQEFPPIELGDVYRYGNYEYCYGYEWCFGCEAFGPCSDIFYTGNDGWFVRCVNDVPVPGDILESVNGEPITNLYSTFANCTAVTTFTTIPSTVRDMSYAFYCTNLEIGPSVIPEGVSDMSHAFEYCESLITTPVIPSSVTSMDYAFAYCTSITTAPVIPSGVINMVRTFEGCTSLTGTVTINANPEYTEACFLDIDFDSQNLTLAGSSDMLDEFGYWAEKYCEDCNGKCNGGH